MPKTTKKTKKRIALHTLPAGTTPPSITVGSTPSAGTSTPVQAVSSPVATGVVDAPPTGSLPTPPATSATGDLEEFRGFRPKGSQVAVVPNVSAELSSAPDYTVRFGPSAPPVSAIIAALGLASDWRVVRTAIELYSGYSRMQDALAWKEALVLLRQLEPLFEAAVTHDPTVVTAYPGLARFFSAPKVTARAAVLSRKKNAKVKAAKEATPAETSATPAASTVTGRVVTVSG